MFSKLFTLGRGMMSNAAEQITDANSLVILDQELRDAKVALDQASGELAGLAGRRKLAEQKYSQVEQQYLKYQESGKQAVAKGEDGLAGKIAERMLILDQDGTSLKVEIDSYGATEGRLREAVNRTRERIQVIEREISSVKATEAVQKAQSSIVRNATGAAGRASSASDTLERIKTRQAERAARFDAQNELDDAMSGAGLDRELAEAGLIAGPGSKNSILASFSSDQPARIGSTSGFGSRSTPAIAGPTETSEKG